MNSINLRRPAGKDRGRVCREFGLVMTLACTVIGGLMLWNGSANALWPFLLGGLFLIPALFKPRLLEAPERLWMAFAERLSVIMTYLLVTFTFYLVITPIALLMRLLGKDLLQLKLEPERDSYWDPVEADGPGSRPFLPY